jgi:hypothetical protein
MHLFPDSIKYKPFPTLPKPLPNCNFSKIWERKTGKNTQKTAYLAPNGIFENLIGSLLNATKLQ